MPSPADFNWDACYAIPLAGAPVGGVTYDPPYRFMAFNPYDSQLYVQPTDGSPALYAPVNVGQVQAIANSADPAALIANLPPA